MAEPAVPDYQKRRRRTRTYDMDADFGVLLGSVVALLCPAGTVIATLAAAAPPGDGWKLCDGQWLAKADYPRLHAVLGSTWGEDALRFRLPDLRGRLLIGTGGLPALALGTMHGAHEVTLTEAQMPAHDHPVTDPGHGHAVADPGHVHAAALEGAEVTAGAGLKAALAGDTDSAMTGITLDASVTGLTVGSAGGGEAVPILPPVAAINWLVRT